MNRRTFLADAGLGFPALALASMLYRDGFGRTPVADAPGSPGRPHFAPKAKSVIWLFMIGGVSHMESFDPKPALTKYAGMSIDDTPHKDVLASPYLDKNLRVVDTKKKVWKTIYPLQVGLKPFGQSGIELADNWPHVGSRIDDVAVIRSMWTTDDNHGAQLQFHTGRHLLDGLFPSLGSWVHYGLGSLNDNLPQFVVLGGSLCDRFGGNGGHRGDYLGPEHDGVGISVDPKNPMPYAAPPRGTFAEEQRAEFELLGDLNRLSAAEYPADPELRARVKAYELAFRMQKSLPEGIDFAKESEATRRLYGLDDHRVWNWGLA